MHNEKIAHRALTSSSFASDNGVYKIIDLSFVKVGQGEFNPFEYNANEISVIN